MRYSLLCLTIMHYCQLKITANHTFLLLKIKRLWIIYLSFHFNFRRVKSQLAISLKLQSPFDISRVQSIWTTICKPVQQKETTRLVYESTWFSKWKIFVAQGKKSNAITDMLCNLSQRDKGSSLSMMPSKSGYSVPFQCHLSESKPEKD